MFDSDSSMEIIQLVFGIFVLITIKFLIFRVVFDYFRRNRLNKEDLKYDRIRHVYRKLKKNIEPNKKLIRKYTSDLENRILIYEALEKFNRLDLFPPEIIKQEKIFESYFANWLNMHDEYDSLPDEIEYIDSYELENSWKIFIYKFKNYEPHLFANKGWMYGYIADKTTDSIVKNPEFIESDFSSILLNIIDLKAKINNATTHQN